MVSGKKLSMAIALMVLFVVCLGLKPARADQQADIKKILSLSGFPEADVGDILTGEPGTPGGPLVYDALGARYTILATGEQTNGQFGLVDVINPPGVGVPPHIHSRENEAYYILDGDLTVLMGDETMTATPGSYVYLPNRRTHAFMTSGAKSVHMLGLLFPAGFEQFFADVGVPVKDLSAPIAPPLDLATIESIASSKYGLQFVAIPGSPTPVPEPSAWWGLLGFGVYLSAGSVRNRKHKKQKLANLARIASTI